MSATKQLRNRLTAGALALLVALSAQPIHAYCIGGVVSGVHDVYKCMNTCPDFGRGNFKKYVRKNCVIVCCPDGTAQYNFITCDEDWDVVWTNLGDDPIVDCCPDRAPFLTEGYEYSYVNCSPTD